MPFAAGFGAAPTHTWGMLPGARLADTLAAMASSDDASEDPTERRRLAVLAALCATVVVLAAIDLFADVSGGTTIRHVLVEGGLLLVGVIGFALAGRRVIALVREARESRAAMRSLATDLAASQREAARWRGETQDLLAGLGAAIDRQFGRWGLTPAEREVAMLLLKGLSHKEIARLRQVGEATVRQQAKAVYHKANVAGRHDLAAFFLEDLLLPSQSGAMSS